MLENTRSVSTTFLLLGDGSPANGNCIEVVALASLDSAELATCRGLTLKVFALLVQQHSSTTSSFKLLALVGLESEVLNNFASANTYVNDKFALDKSHGLTLATSIATAGLGPIIVFDGNTINNLTSADSNGLDAWVHAVVEFLATIATIEHCASEFSLWLGLGRLTRSLAWLLLSSDVHLREGSGGGVLCVCVWKGGGEEEMLPHVAVNYPCTYPCILDLQTCTRSTCVRIAYVGG
mmetsp:Transcript_35735/g.72518  ORF Transcript_35735/g.72518 Transcript_35735/m.72518 type:complete len:237 (-) Transcript_35735:612-1322(-)